MDPNDTNNSEDTEVFYGSSTDAFDIRYQDDEHQTYGKQYEEVD